MPRDHGVGADGDMLANRGSWKHDGAVAEPTAITNRHRLLGHRLLRNRDGEILITMVLIGDVHVMTGPNIVTDLNSEVANDSAALADQAAIADRDHWIADAYLIRHHARRQGDVRPQHGSRPNVDVPLVEDRVGRKADDAGRTKPTESFAFNTVWPNRADVAGAAPQ